MSEEWGPLVKHDGARPDELNGGQRVILFYDNWNGGLVPKPSAAIDNLFPSFFWRWKRVKTGWLQSELRRVCDDPAYAPIKAYRIRKPRGLTILEELLESLPNEVDA